MFRAVPNILFSLNSRPNSVFIFGQIVMQRSGQIRIISTVPSLLVVPDLAVDSCCLSPYVTLYGVSLTFKLPTGSFHVNSTNFFKLSSSTIS